MTAQRILLEARQLITEPKNWAQGKDVRTSDKTSFPICMGIAIDRVSHALDPVCREKAIDILKSAIDGAGIIRFNDSHSHAEVLAALDRAAVLAEESQSC